MNTMKKYGLLSIPLILFSWDLLSHFNFQIVLNMIIVWILLAILLKRTTLQNIFDWIIGSCFSIYFCFLYMKTIKISLFYSQLNHTTEEIKRMITLSVNLIPFKGIIDILQHNPSAFYQVFGNGIMLAPFTFAMLYFKWVISIRQAIWYSFLCTVAIEFIQFIQTCISVLFGLGEGRSADIDDVILNTISAVIGIVFYLLWCKIENRFSRKIRDGNMPI